MLKTIHVYWFFNSPDRNHHNRDNYFLMNALPRYELLKKTHFLWCTTLIIGSISLLMFYEIELGEMFPFSVSRSYLWIWYSPFAKVGAFDAMNKPNGLWDHNISRIRLNLWGIQLLNGSVCPQHHNHRLVSLWTNPNGYDDEETRNPHLDLICVALSMLAVKSSISEFRQFSQTSYRWIICPLKDAEDHNLISFISV